MPPPSDTENNESLSPQSSSGLTLSITFVLGSSNSSSSNLLGSRTTRQQTTTDYTRRRLRPLSHRTSPSTSIVNTLADNSPPPPPPPPPVESFPETHSPVLTTTTTTTTTTRDSRAPLDSSRGSPSSSVSQSLPRDGLTLSLPEGLELPPGVSRPFLESALEQIAPLMVLNLLMGSQPLILKVFTRRLCFIKF